MTPSTLKDFYYLDIDRVKSLVAQLREGAPETVQDVTADERGGGLNLPLKASYVYQRTATETRSLHHYLYELLEDQLRSEGKLTLVDESWDKELWNHDRLGDGAFVLARGRVRVLDWGAVVGALEATPRIAKIAARFGKQTLDQQRRAGVISQSDYQQLAKNADPLAPYEKDIKDIANVVREIYADTLRIKAYPFAGDGQKQLVGNGAVEYLQQPRGAFFASGTRQTIADGWILGLLSAPSVESPDVTGDLDVLDDKLEAMVTGLEQISVLASGISLPRMALSPIAIYRLV